MQAEAIAGGATSSGTVRGLGVCDALSVELQPCQLPWLIDELEEMRGPLEDELQRLRCGCDGGDREELERSEYELRLLRMVRAQLPGAGRQERPVELVGPSGMIGEVALNTMRHVVDVLSDLAHARPAADPQVAARLRDTAAAANAWVRTVLDCRAVEAFSLDPDADPTAAW
jgi:hypothetical protein